MSAPGITVAVSEPQPHTPSPTAVGHHRHRAVLITTTITNHGDEPYPFNRYVVGPNGATHDGQDAPEVLDAATGIGGGPMTVVLPGRSHSYRTVLSIGAAPAELALCYTADPTGPPTVIVLPT